MQRKIENRNSTLDLIRFIAIVLVVLCHVGEATYPYNNTPDTELFSTIIHSIARYGVPLFLFLTGALILKKPFESKEDIKNFYKNNFSRLLITFEIWYILYYLIDILYFKKTFKFFEFLPTLFFIKEYPMSQAWYIPMIIGIYLTLPFISICIQKFPNAVKIIMCINVIYVFVVPFINLLLEVFHSIYRLPVNTGIIAFGGGCFGTYIMTGYFISKFHEKKRGIITYIFAAIICLSLFATTLAIRTALKCDSWYTMFSLFLSSAALYYILYKIPTHKLLSKPLAMLSNLSFGVYLIHKIIIDIFDKYQLQSKLTCTYSIKIIIYLLLSLLISYLICWILSLNKITKKFML